jgi:O-antigen/teichoic acid export membrane protein
MAELALSKPRKARSLSQTIMRTSATNVLVMALSMLTSIMTARLFGVVGKGEFSAILLWPTLLGGLLSFGLPTSLIYNIKQRQDSAGELVRVGFLFQLPVSIIAGVVVWLCLPSWMAGYSEAAVASARWYAVLMLPVLLAINLVSALAQSTGRFHLYNGVRLYVPLFNLVGLLALWAAGLLSLPLAALVFLVTSALVLGWSLYGVRDLFRFQWLKSQVDRLAAKALLGYGSRVFGVDLLGTLYAQFDKVLILSMLGARELGLYTVVYALSRVFNAVQLAITNVIFPKVTGMDKSVIMTTLGRAFRMSMLLMTIVLVPSLFIGHYMLGLLFGAPFLEAGDAFILLSIECIIGGGSWILATSFNAMGRPGLVLVRQIIALAATIALMFALAPAYGLNGIALALLLGAAIRLAATLAAMRLAFRVKLGGLLFDRNDFRYMKDRLNQIRQRKGAQ